MLKHIMQLRISRVDFDSAQSDIRMLVRLSGVEVNLQQ